MIWAVEVGLVVGLMEEREENLNELSRLRDAYTAKMKGFAPSPSFFNMDMLKSILKQVHRNSRKI